MPLTKAIIISMDTRKNMDTGKPVLIPVMFNPAQYDLQKTNEFAEVGIPGLGSSTLQFVKGNVRSLSMELFFDTTDLGIDVRTYTGLLVRLTDVNPRTHTPPRLTFIWGSLIFPCVLEDVRQNFSYFNAAGLPLRATLNVTLKGCDMLETLLAQIPLESSDRAKGWVVKAGDTLQRIAAEEYNDPREWRAIAAANSIDNPLTIQPGQRLVLPVL